jgi:uncharacterized protein (TIGR02246 family)
MRRHHPVATSSVRSAVAVFAAAFGLALAAAPAAASREDEEAIRRVIVEMTESFNRHDARAATRMYTPDADLVTVRGERFRGTEEFEKGLAAIFAGRAREATHRTLDVSVRFVRPDVALAHVTNELSGLIAPDGQRPPPHRELSMRVFVKEAGQWRVAGFHNTLVAPFGAPPPAPARP